MALLITNKQLQINFKNILNTVKFSLFVSVTKNIAKKYPFIYPLLISHINTETVDKQYTIFKIFIT